MGSLRAHVGAQSRCRVAAGGLARGGVAALEVHDPETMSSAGAQCVPVEFPRPHELRGTQATPSPAIALYVQSISSGSAKKFLIDDMDVLRSPAQSRSGQEGSGQATPTSSSDEG